MGAFLSLVSSGLVLLGAVVIRVVCIAIVVIGCCVFGSVILALGTAQDRAEWRANLVAGVRRLWA